MFPNAKRIVHSGLPHNISLPTLSAHGLQLLSDGRIQEARAFYEQMLSANPESQEAHSGLYRICSELGDQPQADLHLAAAMQWSAVLKLPCHCTQEPIPVLMLISIHGCNSLMLRYLNPNLFQIHIGIVEFIRDTTSFPKHSLIVNAVGDPDVRSEALATAKRILSRLTAPVINPPDRILETGRCRSAQRLASIPNVLTAHSKLFPREHLAAPAIHMLQQQGFEFPLLVRSPGYHMGQNFIRIEQAGDLGEAIAELPGNDLIVMQYLDGRGADGNFRKYRVLMIDGNLYPVHLAIAKHWKIHYFNADMADSPEHRAEDVSFLADFEATLGPSALQALIQIQATLGLDYAGIDFGLNEDRQILLYEANATMAVHPPDADPKWDYRRPAIERIYAKVQELFLRSLANPQDCY